MSSARYCSFTAVQQSAVTRHEKLHSGVKPFQCPQCEFRAVEMSRVKKHMRVHKADGGAQSDRDVGAVDA